MDCDVSKPGACYVSEVVIGMFASSSDDVEDPELFGGGGGASDSKTSI